jgi:hypothetical protein
MTLEGFFALLCHVALTIFAVVGTFWFANNGAW